MVESLSKVLNNEEKITRRKFIKGGLLLLAGAVGLNSLDAVVGRNISQRPAHAAEQSQYRDITEEEINRYMAMDTVEEILEGTNIQYAQYKGKGRTNLHELLDTGKPALVLFYTNKDLTGASKRDAIMFKKLAEKYGDRINFVAYKEESRLEKNKFDGMFKLANLFGSTTYGCPSIVMFSYFDLLKGETPNKNNGKLKQIDILRGGPETDQQIPNNLRNFDNWWVKINLLEPLTDKTYRFENTYKFKKHLL